VDVTRRCQADFPIMRYERPNDLRVSGNQRERVHRPAARGEQVGGSANRRDQTVEVVGVLLRR
jgi:hypothetical protein